jgi:hypothetical protein
VFPEVKKNCSNFFQYLIKKKIFFFAMECTNEEIVDDFSDIEPETSTEESQAVNPNVDYCSAEAQQEYLNSSLNASLDASLDASLYYTVSGTTGPNNLPWSWPIQQQQSQPQQQQQQQQRFREPNQQQRRTRRRGGQNARRTNTAIQTSTPYLNRIVCSAATALFETRHCRINPRTVASRLRELLLLNNTMGPDEMHAGCQFLREVCFELLQYRDIGRYDR